MEPWEKVLVNAESFPETDHGQLACTDCHGGVQSPDKEMAHEALIAAPSDRPEEACAECHEDETQRARTSLHATQQGYWTILEARGASHDDPAMVEMFGNHCASCHTSCGDCHVSQPTSVGGGFLDGHLFTSDPPMSRTCTACHGSRVGNEYLGKNEDQRPDVHFRQERMTCIDCHEEGQLHGPVLSQGEPAPDHRYDGEPGPACQDCHLKIGRDGIAMHEEHGDKLACQVCHSVAYTSCESCHVAISEETGRPFFTVANSFLGFLIGRNPLQSEERPYEYTPVRHVPVDPDSFSYYGQDLLPGFDAEPTWRHTTPHNIQRETPQTESCNACHGNPALFLTADKVASEEMEANLDVIVPSVPEARD